MNRVPIACNMMLRGVKLSCILCRFCLEADEYINHLFFSCYFSGAIWRWFNSWSVVLIPVNIIELFYQVKLRCFWKKKKGMQSDVESNLFGVLGDLESQ